VWSVDLINNLDPAKDESHHVLVMVDNYSKFCLLSLLPNKSSAAVTSALQQKLFSVFGAPAALKCDNGTE
jgi:IS30 family transposase